MQHYNTQDNTNQRYTIWLVTKSGEVLIKNTGYIRNVDISDITLKADTLQELVKYIESKWGILTSSDSFEQIYTFNENSLDFTVYILKISLDRDSKLLIEEKFNGRFISFRDIDQKFNYSRKSIEFLESFTALISKLDNEFGIKLPK